MHLVHHATKSIDPPHSKNIRQPTAFARHHTFDTIFPRKHIVLTQLKIRPIFPSYDTPAILSDVLPRQSIHRDIYKCNHTRITLNRRFHNKRTHTLSFQQTPIVLIRIS